MSPLEIQLWEFSTEEHAKRAVEIARVADTNGELHLHYRKSRDGWTVYVDRRSAFAAGWVSDFYTGVGVTLAAVIEPEALNPSKSETSIRKSKHKVTVSFEVEDAASAEALSEYVKRAVADAAGPDRAPHYTVEVVDVVEQDPYVCAVCGSEDVQHAAWVMLNTGEALDDFGSWCSGDNSWCEKCDAHTQIIRKSEVQS